MALFKKSDSKDVNAMKALEAELEKLKSTTKALQAELKKSKTELEETKRALAEALKKNEVKKPAPPKAKTIKDGHEYVDLGLPSGVKWATCNVGANKPEEFGDYFAWGETKPKKEYTYENSKTYAKERNDFSASARYDVARVSWGGGWRMPTQEEAYELIEKCSWVKTKQNGICGYRTEGPNGNSIFIPCAGYRRNERLVFDNSMMCCWTSTPDDWCHASSLSSQTVSSLTREIGLPVRPIIK